MGNTNRHLKAVAGEGSWAGADRAPEYDPNKVYVKGRGGTELMSLRLPESQVRFIAEMVQGHYHADIKTASDFVRDALHHRIEHWRGVLPDLDTNALDLQAQLDEADALAAEMELAARVGPTWVKVLGEAVKTGDRATVLKAVAKANKALGTAPRPARKPIEAAIVEARDWLRGVTGTGPTLKAIDGTTGVAAGTGTE